MCGIVGYVGEVPALEVLLASLDKLQYRGDDSAGISVHSGARLNAVRTVGNLSALQAEVQHRFMNGGANGAVRSPAKIGIGHTRWATHGRVCEANAHPHSDAEVSVHLVSRELNGDGLVAAVHRTYSRLRGHYAFVVLAADHPDALAGARRDCPLVVGRGEGEQFVASAIPAFLGRTRRVQQVENGEIVAVHRGGVDFFDERRTPTRRAVEEFDGDGDAAEKGSYGTFMLKEIHEQADAVAQTIADRTVRSDGVDLDLSGIGDDVLTDCRRIVVVGCGTSYHAGLIARYALERWLRIPIEMDIASEYRYRDPVVGPGDLVVGISQSGETADTLATL